ncbi:hypothetical protein [uncultured Cardiobacterium sp.]|uniref:hypothetical protein n=1 Tax=uncultured Cardiobacterium sp. TaxID=417619 RepID=UPI00262E2BF2|nr:hypothetical protein [uncultured Cardiobacterium sp.]
MTFDLRSGFLRQKRQMQGKKRSKVGHLARICNAAAAGFWPKSRRNVECQQTLIPKSKNNLPYGGLQPAETMRMVG